MPNTADVQGPRKINDVTLDLIKQWEGLKLSAYQDVAGVWTIGYGHTGNVRPNERITETQAENLLRIDLERFESAVDRLVTVPLNDNQFGALVSFAFNVGEGSRGFGGSTLLRELNAGDYGAVPIELAKWNRAGGRVVTGLVNRRAAEAGLWVRGEFVSSNTVETTPPAGKIEANARPLSIGGSIVGITALLAEQADRINLLNGWLNSDGWFLPVIAAVSIGGLAYTLWSRTR